MTACKKIILCSVLAFGLSFGIMAIATPVGKQMEKLDAIGLLIELVE